jgi:hypothetical protein
MTSAVTSDEGQVASPEIVAPFVLNGRGWWSPELYALCVDFNRSDIAAACEEFELDPRRQNVPALRAHLESMEARLK